MIHRMRRRTLAGVLALGLVGGLPAIAAAAAPETAPPDGVVAWQEMLAHMQAGGPLGRHLSDCVALHGSMAGQLGPNGAMVGMMAGHMAGANR